MKKNIGLYLSIFVFLQILFLQDTQAEVVFRPHIVGGATVNDSTWSSTISLEYCSAVAINPNTIITAAHCITSANISTRSKSIKLHTGNTRMNGKTYKYKEIIVHPNFNKNYFNNDIALIKLASSLPSSVQAPSVVTNPQEVEFLKSQKYQVQVVGFGLTSSSSRASMSRNKKYMNANIEDKKSDVWVLRATKGNDSCNGDSGGGAYVKIGKTHYLLAITVGGAKRCASELTSYYVSIADHWSWILSLIK